MLAVLALTLAACGGGGDGDDEADGGDDAAADDAADDTTDDTMDDEGDDEGDDGGDEGDDGGDGEPVDLTVWFAREYYVPPDEFETFHENNPNVNVEFDVVPADDIFDQLVRMQEAGEDLPDVVQMDGFFQNLMYEAGIAIDITEQIETWEEEDPELYDEVYPSVWEDGTWDGNIVGMANTAQVGQFFVRTDWLEEAGVDEWPDSWQGILDVLPEFQSVMDEGYPIGIRGTRGSANRAIGKARAIGVEYNDNNIPQIDTEAGHNFIQWHLDIMNEGLAHPDTITWGSGERRAAFNGGTTAVAHDTIGKAVDTIDAGLEYGENFELFLLPLRWEPDGEENGVLTSWYRTWQVTTEENAYEASLVLRYLISEQQAVDVTLQGGDLPRTASVLENEEVASEIAGFNDEFAEGFTGGSGPPPSLQWFEIQDVWELLMQDILQNYESASAEELAQTYQAEFDAIEG